MSRWREPLREALGPNGQLMVNLVPELELDHRHAAAGRRTCRRRMRRTASRWCSGASSSVFARKEHPLALFLDDLQWLDSATLDLLEHLVTHPEVRHLLLVGAYRDNEVGPAHPLIRTLESDSRGGGEGWRRSC